MRWWSKAHQWVYGALILLQVVFIVGNVATGTYRFAALNGAAIAVIYACEVFVARIEARRRTKVAEYRAAIVAARTQGIEDAEVYFMTLLHIWGGDPP